MKKKHKFALTLASAFVFAPHFAFAEIATFRDLMQTFVTIMGNAMSLLYAVAFAGFFWGIMLFVLNGNDERKRAEGKQWIKWSIIALFVMLTLWGIVGVLTDTFNISTPVIPQLPTA